MSTLSRSAPSPAGEFACVAAAWQSHESELRGFLRKELHDAPAAEDLLQDLFVKAMRQGQGFCSLGNPRAWLFQVARNALIDRARAQRPHLPLDADGLELEAPIPEPTAPVEALAACVDRVLAELPPDDASILRACDLGGQTQRRGPRATFVASLIQVRRSCCCRCILLPASSSSQAKGMHMTTMTLAQRTQRLPREWPRGFLLFAGLAWWSLYRTLAPASEALVAWFPVDRQSRLGSALQFFL